MLIIIDQNTKHVITNKGLNSIYPDGNIPGVEAQMGQEIVRIHDNSEIAQKIMLATADGYTLVFDSEGNVTDATVTAWLADQPVVTNPTTEDYLIDLDFRLCMIELGLN